MPSDIVGQVLLNQYQVESFLASGGMATVFRVRDLKRNVPLAMKVLNTDLAEDPSMLKRFKREARALQKLVHPHIVPFYGLHQSDEITFLLELFIDGPTLKEVLQRAPHRTLSLQETLIYLKALCAALGYAHANDVVHCDIKPGNVMVDRGGNIYLADFGIARHTDSTTTTMAGAGTAAYMAPEQIREEAVSPATDIYALGVMTFEMLTGQRPFHGVESSSSSRGGTTAERLRYAHLTRQPPDPRQFRPELSPAVSDVLLRALAKNPQQRYPTTLAFFIALCEAAGLTAESVPDRVPLGSLSAWYDFSETDKEPERGKVLYNKPAHFSAWLNNYWIFVVVGVVVVAMGLIVPRLVPGVSTSLEPSPSNMPLTASPATPATRTPQMPPTDTVPPAQPTDTPEPTPIPSNTPLPIEVTNNPMDGSEMALIPQGEFTMGAYDGESPIAFWGAEGPAHKVYLDAYWIYRTEVTNRMYTLCVEAKACPRPERESTDAYPDYYTNVKYADYPVANVTWTGAQSYCVWAGGSLPSEAQWEKAARGDDRRFFPWGNESPGSDKVNYCDVNCLAEERNANIDDHYRETAPVGSFPQGASIYGVLDMSGNAYEWVWDWFDAGYYQRSAYENPPGPASGTTRVVRGGSWINPAEAIQTVVRNYYKPTRAFDYLGFRCTVNDSD